MDQMDPPPLTIYLACFMHFLCTSVDPFCTYLVFFYVLNMFCWIMCAEHVVLTTLAEYVVLNILNWLIYFVRFVPNKCSLMFLLIILYLPFCSEHAELSVFAKQIVLTIYFKHLMLNILLCTFVLIVVYDSFVLIICLNILCWEFCDELYRLSKLFSILSTKQFSFNI